MSLVAIKVVASADHRNNAIIIIFLQYSAVKGFVAVQLLLVLLTQLGRFSEIFGDFHGLKCDDSEVIYNVARTKTTMTIRDQIAEKSAEKSTENCGK